MSEDDFGDLFNAKRKPTASSTPPLGTYPNGPGHRGVDTSVSAAKSVRAQVPFMHQRILSYLVDCAAHGAIYTEIAARCRLEVPTVCGRMVELCASGAVKKSKRQRKTPSGRGARVYVHKDFWNASVDEEKPT